MHKCLISDIDVSFIALTDIKSSIGQNESFFSKNVITQREREREKDPSMIDMLL